MIKQVVTYGCSFTEGEGVDHYKSWPYCLGYNLKMKTLNRGKGGGSNKFIAAEFFRDLDNGTLEDSLVIIAWTSHLRTAFWNEKNRQWDHVVIQYMEQENSRKKDITYFYHNIFQEYSAYFETLLEKIAVKNTLEKYNIPYIFLNALHEGPFKEISDGPLKIMKELTNSSRYMDFDTCMHLLILTDRRKYICQDDFHPSELGHIYLAQRITDFIEQNNILEIK